MTNKRYQRWTEDELALLRSSYVELGAWAIAAKLGRTPVSIRAMANTLGLTRGGT